MNHSVLLRLLSMGYNFATAEAQFGRCLPKTFSFYIFRL